MNQLFNPDNPVMRLLSKFCDLITVNILFIITSIPIFTIGASISALYNITLKIVNNDDPYITKGYFKAFRQSFKQATLIWIPIFFLLIFFGVDLYVVYNIIPQKYSAFQFPVWIFIYIILSIIIYAFPMIGRYQATTKQLLKNAVLLSLANIPTTIMIIAIYVGIGYVATTSPKSLIVVFSLLLFFGFSCIAYFNSFFLLRIFFKCDPQEETETQNKEEMRENIIETTESDEDENANAVAVNNDATENSDDEDSTASDSKTNDNDESEPEEDGTIEDVNA